MNRVEVNLSALAGQHIRFILRVDAWGSADADNAFWLNPHIDGEPRMDVIPFCPNCD
ncbi:MAG TPA: hypothetical protein VI451_17605 [Anaerolineales bacterium]|nr:hypothetical protein [Anaerolineales bacterium]